MPNSLKYSCSYNTGSSKSKELEHWKFIFNFITDRCSLLSLAPAHIFPCIFFNYSDWSWGDWFKSRAFGYLQIWWFICTVSMVGFGVT